MPHDHRVSDLDVNPQLGRLLDELRRLSPRCRLLVESVCGEPDVRVEVRCPADELAVELLCCLPGAAATPCWHAVRVGGERRQVWQGPPSDCPASEVVRFVADLLKGTDDELARRYVLLG